MVGSNGTEVLVARQAEFHTHFLVGGDRGAGARENRGREGYGRRREKGGKGEI